VTEEPSQDQYLPEQDGGEGPEEEIKAPFGFKLMIVLTCIYLGYRLIQGIVWVVEQITK
jgi:hypothetical protein